MEVQSSLKKAFADGWNNRWSASQWAHVTRSALHLNGASSSSSMDASSDTHYFNDSSNLLCEFLLQQCAVGEEPSALLLAYVRYALRKRLVSECHFFDALCSVASPTLPRRFAAFLSLLHEFAPLLGSLINEDDSAFKSESEEEGEREGEREDSTRATIPKKKDKNNVQQQKKNSAAAPAKKRARLDVDSKKKGKEKERERDEDREDTDIQQQQQQDNHKSNNSIEDAATVSRTFLALAMLLLDGMAHSLHYLYEKKKREKPSVSNHSGAGNSLQHSAATPLDVDLNGSASTPLFGNLDIDSAGLLDANLLNDIAPNDALLLGNEANADIAGLLQFNMGDIPTGNGVDTALASVGLGVDGLGGEMDLTALTEAPVDGLGGLLAMDMPGVLTAPDGVGGVPAFALPMATAPVHITGDFLEQDAEQQKEANELRLLVQNMMACAEILHSLLVQYRTLRYLLLAKKHSASWQRFCSRCEALYPLLQSQQDAYPMLHGVWTALQRILNDGGIGYECRASLHDTLFALYKRHYGNAYNKPWLGLSLIVKEEQTYHKFRTIAESADRLRMMKVFRDMAWYPFLSELWTAAIRLIYTNKINTTASSWFMSKNFLLSKLPLIIKIWKDEIIGEKRTMDNNNNSDDSANDLSQFNAIELSLAHIAQFPTLAAFASPSTLLHTQGGKNKSTHGGSSGEGVVSSGSTVPKDLIDVCVLHGLVDRRKIDVLLSIETASEHTHDTMEYTLDDIAAGKPPKTDNDVEQLFEYLRSDLEEDRLVVVVRCICHVYQVWQVQDRIVSHLLQYMQNILQDPSTNSHHILARLFSGLTTRSAIDVFHLHGEMPAFINCLIKFCDLWGTKPREVNNMEDEESESSQDQEYTDNHSCFSAAFLLLLTILEHYDVRAIQENQEIIQEELDGYKASMQNYDATGEASFASWYVQYIMSHVGEGHSDPSLGSVGIAIIETYGGDYKAMRTALQPICATSTPFQILEAVPYIGRQLVLSTIQDEIDIVQAGERLRALVAVCPSALVPILFWLAREVIIPLSAYSNAAGDKITIKLLVQLITTLPLSSRMKSAVGPQLKRALEAMASARDLEPVRTALESVELEAWSEPTPMSTLVQTRIFRALQETVPTISFTLFRRYMHKLGNREFIDMLLKTLASTLPTGMGSRHALRGAEMTGITLAVCGGRELVCMLLSNVLEQVSFANKTYLFGQVVAYAVHIAIVMTGMHHLQPDAHLPHSMEVQALNHVFELVTQQIEQQIASPSSGGSFGRTFVALATGVPSLLRYCRQSGRLAAALNQLEATDLSLAVLLATAQNNS